MEEGGVARIGWPQVIRDGQEQNLINDLLLENVLLDKQDRSQMFDKDNRTPVRSSRSIVLTASAGYKSSSCNSSLPPEYSPGASLLASSFLEPLNPETEIQLSWIINNNFLFKFNFPQCFQSLSEPGKEGGKVLFCGSHVGGKPGDWQIVETNYNFMFFAAMFADGSNRC